MEVQNCEIIEKNNLSTQQIANIIESMTKINQIKVLKILSKFDVNLNENNYGVHVNLTDIHEDITKELIKFIDYVNAQETVLNVLEKEKQSIHSIYFTKDNKDNLAINYNESK